jgi:hypothetical protein
MVDVFLMDVVADLLASISPLDFERSCDDDPQNVL